MCKGNTDEGRSQTEHRLVTQSARSMAGQMGGGTTKQTERVYWRYSVFLVDALCSQCHVPKRPYEPTRQHQNT